MHPSQRNFGLRATPLRTLLAAAATIVAFSAVSTEAFARGEQSSPSAQQAKKQQKAFRNANASLGPSRHSGRSFSGIASFYGNNVGNKTASGQRYNENGMTAAHRTLPFGTKVKVTHRNRSVLVTINDRGPFIRGRVIDLSKGAARVVGLTGRGIGHVVAEIQ